MTGAIGGRDGVISGGGVGGRRGGSSQPPRTSSACALPAAAIPIKPAPSNPQHNPRVPTIMPLVIMPSG